MKRATLIMTALLICGAAFGQTLNTWDTDVMRARKAIHNLNHAPYAWMTFNESAAISISAEDTWYTVSQGDSLWNNGVTSNVTLNKDSLLLTVDGDYYFDLSASYKATANDTIHLGVKHNSTVYQGPRAVSIGAEVITISWSGVIQNMDSGDTVIVQTQNSNNTDNPTFLDGSFMFMLHTFDE